MAKTDIGKKWEDRFRRAWMKQFPGTFLYRLADQMTGYKETSGNPCDFLSMANASLFMVECKEHKGASIPFDAIPQYDRLLKYKDIENVYPGILLWLSEKERVFWVGIKDMEKLYLAGEKSIGLRHVDDPNYSIIEVPTQKLLIYLEPDLKYLVDKLTGDK